MMDSVISSFLSRARQAEGQLWVVDDAATCASVAAAIDARARALGAVTLQADWRAGFARPFGPLLDTIEDAAVYLDSRRPEVLGRFAWMLSNLLYPWRRSRTLYRVGELRAGLADLALRGDARCVHEFFQKRNVRPQMLAYIVRLITEAARVMTEETHGPVVLHVQNAHLADSLTLSAFHLLRRYAQQQRVPLKVCLIGTSNGASAFADLVGRGAEPGWTLAMPRGMLPPRPHVLAAYSAEELEALTPASAYALPFRPADWLAHVRSDLRRTASVLQDAMIEAGILTWVGPQRLRFARADVRDAIYANQVPEAVAAIHADLLDSDDAGDPFAAAWHATAARSDTRGARYLEAMERAWVLSAYECALDFARAAFAHPPAGSAIDPNLVLALLNYEAGRYEESDSLFDAALEAAHPIVDAGLIRYLKGYNAVFGTGEYAKGIGLLSSVLHMYEQKGDARTAAYVRNSIAYAHFRAKQIPDAMRTEETNIRELNPEQTTDSFLHSILQLNLGRLYNHVGDLDTAIQTVEAGLHPTRKELSSHTLLLCYASLGSMQAAAGRYDRALQSYRHVFALMRNMQLDSVKDQVVFALSKLAPQVPAETMTRTDDILFYVHFHLGRMFQSLGFPQWASPFREAVIATASVVSPDFEDAARTAFDRPLSKPPKPAAPRAPLAAHDVPHAVRDMVRDVMPRSDSVDVIAATVADGGTAAILDEHDAGGGVRLLQSVVIYDARSVETAERISSEFGGSHIHKAAAALILPEAVDLFVQVEPRCGVQQIATVRHECCSLVPGLVPVGLNVQVVSEQFDGVLYRMLKVFADRSGLPLLGVAPFHLWRGDLVTMAEQAVLDFLVTSLDRLYLTGRVIEKVHGPAALQNIARYKPRLSEEALIFESRGSCLIRIKRKGGYWTDQMLKVHPDARAIIDLCDGRRDVGTLVALLTRSTEVATPQGERLASLLRGLWRHGALCFDPPVPERTAAMSSPAAVH